MAHYLMLAKFTDRGIEKIQETLNRAEQTVELVDKAGGRVKSIWWTVGPYDVAITIEAPDDESVTAAAFAISSRGNLRTTTLRGFDRDEMRAILERVS
jgi:uncharacterized protein with GYD domain